MSDVKLTDVEHHEVVERERSVAYLVGLAAVIAIAIIGVIYAAVMIGRTVGG